MDKIELHKILEEKENEISKIKNEIKNLLTTFASSTTIFKKDDQLTSSTFNNKSVILRCIGDFEYQQNIESIIVFCEVISTNSDKIKIGDIYAISEKFLTKI